MKYHLLKRYFTFIFGILNIEYWIFLKALTIIFKLNYYYYYLLDISQFISFLFLWIFSNFSNGGRILSVEKLLVILKTEKESEKTENRKQKELQILSYGTRTKNSFVIFWVFCVCIKIPRFLSLKSFDNWYILIRFFLTREA